MYILLYILIYIYIYINKLHSFLELCFLGFSVFCEYAGPQNLEKIDIIFKKVNK